MLMIQDRNLTAHTYNRATAEVIAGHIRDRYRPCFQQLRQQLNERLPSLANQRLLQVLQGCLRVEAVVLFGSRAMGRHRDGSDVDLCLVGEAITHVDRLQLMHAMDELLLPWQVDLALQHELPPELLDHVNRVGIPIWARDT